MSQVLLFNKPFGVLSQFTGAPVEETLSAYIKQPGFYAAGRLDKDSEGLLILTNDGKLQQFIANPTHKQAKTYLAQVEGDVTDAALAALEAGLLLKDGMTKPAQARRVPAPDLWERVPPIRQRKHIPTSWIELQIHEGRNRQVRRMTAAVGFPTLRLIRTRVAQWELADLRPGCSQVLDV